MKIFTSIYTMFASIAKVLDFLERHVILPFQAYWQNKKIEEITKEYQDRINKRNEEAQKIKEALREDTEESDEELRNIHRNRR